MLANYRRADSIYASVMNTDRERPANGSQDRETGRKKMNAYMTQIVARIENRIAELRADVMIETNEGTFSAQEALKKVGTGDPKFANYRIMESLDGGRRTIGCDPSKAPGRAIRGNVLSASDRRKEISRLENLAKGLPEHPAHEPLPAGAMAFAV
jgi:hypothetical protein